ncbi:MAG: ABC transporter ATP-binding protein [Acidimicrobiales bacterium]
MAALLELEHIAKRFGGVVVADDISLAVDPGSAVGVVGPNGAGKTTLFGVISGDVRPDAGAVRFDGSPVNRLGSAARCRLGIGRTYQVPKPFERMSVFENVLVATQHGARTGRTDSFDEAITVLERCGLFDKANRPAGSLGLLDRKRLELARALATKPRLLLLDEVAGGLTDPEVRELVGIVRSIGAEGTAVVWIEHVVRALVGAVERLLCLSGGTFIADGEPRAVLESPAVREVYMGNEELAIEGTV